MSVFTKLLRAGEGKRVRQLAELIGPINDLAGEVSGPDRRRAAGQDRRLPPAPGRGRDPRRPPDRGLRRGARGRDPGPGPAPLRRPADGGDGPALWLDRRDEDRRGQDPGLDPAGLPERPGRAGRPRGDGQRLPGDARRRLDGPGAPLPRDQRRPGRARPAGLRRQAGGLRLRRDLRHQHRVRLRLPARQHGAPARAHGPARPPLRHRRRGRLDPHRRGAHAAHHLGALGGRVQALLPVRLDREDAGARRRLRGRRGEEDGDAPARAASRRSSASWAWPTSTTRSAPTTSTSWARRCGPRSSTTATATTWSTPARSRSSTSSPAAPSRGGAGPTGSHQAVEAKERVRIQEENHTWATVTLQNYFRLYDKLAGMTGTAETEASEFGSTYSLSVVPIPTNLPSARGDDADLIYKTEAAKFALDRRGRPGALRPGPARPPGHRQRREVRAAEPRDGQGRHPPRGPQRQAALPRGRDRGPGRPPARDHRGHQHGRARRRHRAGRQRRRPGPARRRRPGPRAGHRGVRRRGDQGTRAAARDVRRRGRGGHRRGRALRARDRAPRVEAHRQPAARPVRAPGRPRREPLLPVPRGRPDAPLRHRRRVVGDGPHHARRAAHRGQDGLQGHRARPEHRRGAATPRSARTSSSTTRS